jgi:hypothetical protein
LVTLAVRASNGDKCRHGPLLREGLFETRPSVTSISVYLHDSNTTHNMSLQPGESGSITSVALPEMRWNVELTAEFGYTTPVGVLAREGEALQAVREIITIVVTERG